MERERREREERDRKERERAKMEKQKERDRQAQEDVDRHFQMSIELAKKVNIDKVLIMVKETLMNQNSFFSLSDKLSSNF